jgi:hypothetical protein
VRAGSYIHFRDDFLVVGEVCGGLRSLIALCALFALVQALIFAVAAYMPLELACASVGIVLALIALAFVARGQSYLKARNLAPRRTMNTMRGQIQRG